jgi:hypothetical protein
MMLLLVVMLMMRMRMKRMLRSSVTCSSYSSRCSNGSFSRLEGGWVPQFDEAVEKFLFPVAFFGVVVFLFEVL